MKSEKRVLRMDLNFLEYPMWRLDKRSKALAFRIETERGEYEFLCAKGSPYRYDWLVFLFLGRKLYNETGFESFTCKTTRHEILKNISCKTARANAKEYRRLMKSLYKWKAVTIKFEGLFYEGEGYTIRAFGVIDEYCLDKETGELTVRFNESFITQQKDSLYSIMFSFEIYKKLKKVVSARLYEILVKRFKSDAVWRIGVQRLAQKMTFSLRKGAKAYYPSDVVQKIKAAVSEINKKSDLYIDFYYNKETGVCIFKKLKKSKKLFLPATKGTMASKEKLKAEKEKELFLGLFNELSQEEQQKIVDGANRQNFVKNIPCQETKIVSFMKRRSHAEKKE